jgi:hypothetical protein
MPDEQLGCRVMVNIFLSYARSDVEIASQIAERLQQAGIGVWLDRAELKPGDSWQTSIEQRLEQADGVLLLLSPASANSAYITREYQYALAKGKPLYIALTGALPAEEIPFALQGFQYVDLTGGDIDARLDELIEAIRFHQELKGAKRLYQSETTTDEQTVTFQTSLKEDNVDELLEQVKKSLESGARTIKVVNVDED